MALAIAKQVLGRETAEQFPMHVIKVSEEWPHDSEVIAELDRIDLIPVSKEILLRDCYQFVIDPYEDHKIKLGAIRLYGEMCGWVKSTAKESGGTNEFLDRLQQLHNAVKNPVET